MTRFLALLYALIFVFAVCSSKPHGSMDADSTDFVTASILHIGPGKDIYSACGHAALRMQCPSHGLDICFGYLVPDGPMLVANTVYGSPKQGLVRIPTSSYLPEIFNEGRAVDQYELNLTDKEKRRLWQILDEESERGAYLDYDYINQGCALSLVGKVKEALIDDTLSINCRGQDLVSCRTVVSRNLSQRPWTAFWMSFMLGEKTNAKRDPDCELMIPSDLIASLQSNFIKVYDGTTRPIIIDAEHLTETPGDKSGGITPLMIALVMLCCCILISTFRVQKLRSRFAKAFTTIFDAFMLMILTGLGLLVISIILFSGLYGTEFNWLILPYNLLPLCWYVFRRKYPTAARCMLGLYILSVTAYLFITQSYLAEQALLCAASAERHRIYALR